MSAARGWWASWRWAQLLLVAAIAGYAGLSFVTGRASTPPVLRTLVPGNIEIFAATYGASCRSVADVKDNATLPLRTACSGLRSCDYTIRADVLGDPAPGCSKDFALLWGCGAGSLQQLLAVPPEAHGQTIALSCGAGVDH